MQLSPSLHAAAGSGTLVIVVTHDLGFAARFADTVLVLDRGRLVASGPPAQALTPAVLADIFRIEAFRAERDGVPVIVPWSAA
jgi:iron complex transport system ATP-binding protein